MWRQVAFNLLQVLKGQKRVEEALEVATEYIEKVPFGLEDSVLLDVGLDSIELLLLSRKEKGQKALKIANKCLTIPGARENPSFLHRVSYIFKDNWRMEEMGQVLQRKLELERLPLSADEAISLGKLTVPNPHWLHKLEHDAEQFEYLANQGINASWFGGVLAPAYRLVYQSMKGTGGGRLGHRDYVAVQSTLHKMSHQAVAPRISGPALNPNLDWPRLESAYLSKEPSVLSIDNFLSPKSLKVSLPWCGQRHNAPGVSESTQSRRASLGPHNRIAPT